MSQLDEIRARIADCKSYNFGMRNADKLAHEDAPRLISALEAVLDRCDHMDQSKPVGSWYYNEITGAIQRALDGK